MVWNLVLYHQCVCIFDIFLMVVFYVASLLRVFESLLIFIGVANEVVEANRQIEIKLLYIQFLFSKVLNC